MLRLALYFAGTALFASNVSAADWPMFRGPHGNGVSPEDKLPAEWGPDKNVKWKVELEGTGNGSPIVSAGRVFVTAATDEGRRRHLHCYDREQGQHLWTKSVEYREADPTHETNPHAPSTPVADGQVVVVFHGSAGLVCYDFDGNEIWKRDLGEFRHIWGFGSSPVIWEDRIFLNAGPGERQRLMALDLKSGETLWEMPEPGGTDGEEKDPQVGWIGSWSTPVVAEVEGRPQVLCSLPTRVVACDPQTGDVLWYVTGLSSPPRGDLVYTSVVIGDGIAVSSGGFQGPAIGFKLGGSGDMTEENTLWRETKGNPQRIGSGVIIDGDLYQANAGPGTVECLDARTGKSRWQARMPGGNSWGSIILAAGRLYVTNQEGTTNVFEPNPREFKLIASNPLGETSNATPAISDGEIFLRTAGHLYCIAE